MKRLIAVLCFCSLPCLAAFGSGTVWRISTVSSSNTNGGAFDPGVGSPGTDESTGAGTAITITSASTTTGTGSPVFSATTHGPGNFVHIASGTGCTVGWYELVSQAAGVATLTPAFADMAARSCVGVIGGPLSTIGQATANTVASNIMCVKNDGTYGLSGNISQPAAGTAGRPTVLQGYSTTCPTDDGAQATIQATSGTSYNMLNWGRRTSSSKT